MMYNIFLDKNSKDKRVGELVKLFETNGVKVYDYNETEEDQNAADGKAVYFLAPRHEKLPAFPKGSLVFGYQKMSIGNYICLSDDEEFIRENNYLTALALKELIIKRFDTANQKILIMGYGKLTTQLEKVFTEADIYILNFNHHKIAELEKKYHGKSYFESAPISEFPIIINTIPKQVIQTGDLKYVGTGNTVYDLASPPYGFDFGSLDMNRFDYNIEPGLPGRFYPDKAAKAVFDCMIKIINLSAKPEVVTDTVKAAQKEQKDSLVLCLTGSPCSYGKVKPMLGQLCEKYNVIPVMSANAGLANRFIDIEEFKTYLREVSGNNIINTIAGSETLSSRKDIVAVAVVPATGNTIAKLANAVTDTPVCMAVKAILRNSKPCIVGISTNDALSGNAANIGLLLNRKNYYFVPYKQDDFINKPFSMVCDFSKTLETVEAALQGKQLQPIIN